VSDPATYEPGSRADFDRLYATTYRQVLGSLRAMLGDHALAEDCAQEAYLKAFSAWPRWKPSAPAEAWIQRIAINTAISAKRKQRLREVGELVRRLGRPPEGPDPAEGGGELAAALRALPTKDAAVIVLRHHHGYSNREIAAALNIPESTVSSRLVAAKERLRRLLGDAGDPAPSVKQERLGVVKGVDESVGSHAR